MHTPCLIVPHGLNYIKSGPPPPWVHCDCHPSCRYIKLCFCAHGYHVLCSSVTRRERDDIFVHSSSSTPLPLTLTLAEPRETATPTEMPPKVGIHPVHSVTIQSHSLSAQARRSWGRQCGPVDANHQEVHPNRYSIVMYNIFASQCFYFLGKGGQDNINANVSYVSLFFGMGKLTQACLCHNTVRRRPTVERCRSGVLRHTHSTLMLTYNQRTGRNINKEGEAGQSRNHTDERSRSQGCTEVSPAINLFLS